MLDINKLNKGFSKIVVGSLKPDVIKTLGITRDPCNIVLWEDRFDYIQKHKPDFKSEESFRLCISKIPEIIDCPDYVAIHPTKNSIEYIKQVDELTIVAVRLRPSGELALRTVFPLTNKQLQDYIQMGTAKKIKSNDT